MAFYETELLRLERCKTKKGTLYFSLSYGGVNDVGTLDEMLEKIPQIAQWMNSQAIINERDGKRGELKIW
jgi:phosphodiesterase/alkaline phosphatase D-like protein